jgi:hypothetical protein
MSSVNHPIPPRVELAETFVVLPAPVRLLTGPMSRRLNPPEAPSRMNNQEFHPLDVVPIAEAQSMYLCEVTSHRKYCAIWAAQDSAVATRTWPLNQLSAVSNDFESDWIPNDSGR